MAKEVKKTTYLIERDAGDLKATVPSAWRVTYGPTTPSKNNGYSGQSKALRFYEGTKQRAVFTDVTSFRDMSIEIVRKVVSVEAKSERKDTDELTTFVAAEKRDVQWVQDEA